jgi:phytoene desaturase
MLTRTPATPGGSYSEVANGAPDTRPHAVVVGSGFGGLAAAIRLGARGYRVTVLERLDAPGGRAYVFRQDGYVFDAGPTIITAPFLLEELWELCGKRMSDEIDLRPMDPFYRIRFDDGRTFDCSGDPEKMRAEVAKLSPGDVAGYERFMAASAEICRIGFEQLGHIPFGSIMDMAKIAPDLLRLKGYKTVHALVSDFVKDPYLQTVLSFHPLLIGGNPFSATAIYALISHLERHWGVHFAMGGTGRLVSGLVGLIAGQGGAVRCDAQVTRILTEGKRACGVELASGETIAADIVVSNADIAHTYKDLLSSSVRKRWTNKKVDGARYSMSLFVWYFGTNKRYEDVPHHTILLGPRYKGLLTDIFTKKHLSEDFSLYLHRPTATDPSLAPEGGDAFYVLSPVPHLDADVDWAEHAEPYRKSIVKYLEATMMPELEAHVATSRVVTPLYFRDRLLSNKGAAFSLEPVLMQSAWFRPHNRSEDVENLFIVGAGTHPGAGLPGVISSARVLDQVVPDAAVFTS